MGLFRFKHFALTDNNCQLKIGTDGVLLAAWASCKSLLVLDVGCSSGLISTIYAHRNPNAKIWGIDINAPAIAEAKENAMRLGLQNHLHYSACAFQDFRAGFKFQQIITNPPFFELPNKNIKSAKHEKQFSLQEFFLYCKKSLSDNGIVSLIYPFNRRHEVITYALKHDLYVMRETQVLPKDGKNANRVLIEFSNQKEEVPEIEVLALRNSNNEFTHQYKRLTHYLYLKF
ncbi:MAG: methyltransferase [Bacteroidetes bacterium]|nr:methyltransferase [Bacteroidota bacterium]